MSPAELVIYLNNSGQEKIQHLYFQNLRKIYTKNYYRNLAATNCVKRNKRLLLSRNLSIQFQNPPLTNAQRTQHIYSKKPKLIVSYFLFFKKFTLKMRFLFLKSFSKIYNFIEYNLEF